MALDKVRTAHGITMMVLTPQQVSQMSAGEVLDEVEKSIAILELNGIDPFTEQERVWVGDLVSESIDR